MQNALSAQILMRERPLRYMSCLNIFLNVMTISQLRDNIAFSYLAVFSGFHLTDPESSEVSGLFTLFDGISRNGSFSAKISLSHKNYNIRLVARDCCKVTLCFVDANEVLKVKYLAWHDTFDFRPSTSIYLTTPRAP